MSAIAIDAVSVTGLYRRSFATAALVLLPSLSLAVLLPLAAELALLAAGIAAVGMLHGGRDLLVAAGVFRRFGRGWVGLFIGWYLAIAAAVLALWMAAPMATILSFFLLSAYHFGDDERSGLFRGAMAWVERFARGSMPIALPVLAHPEAIAATLERLLLTSDQAAAAVGLVSHSAALAVLPTLGLLVGYYLWLSFRRGSGNAFWSAMEVVVWSVVLWLTPPLVAFALYFCLWHSACHVVSWGVDRGGFSVERLIAAVGQALPWTAAALGLLLTGGLLAWSQGSAAEAATGAIFIGLASLAVPHIALEEWAARLERPRSAG